MFSADSITMVSRCCFYVAISLSRFQQDILLVCERRVASADLGMPHLDAVACRRRSDKLPPGVKR